MSWCQELAPDETWQSSTEIRQATGFSRPETRAARIRMMSVVGCLSQVRIADATDPRGTVLERTRVFASSSL